MSLPIAVFASGGGSNLQALIDRLHAPGDDGTAGRVALVVSDRREAGALERAGRAGIPTRVIPVGQRADDEIATETIAALEEHDVELIALAGYTRRVPAPVITRYRDRILNIHPALLPAFGGRGMYGSRVHEAVLAAGCTVSGATVHLVDEEYDRGRILAQWPVPVVENDDAAALAARVLQVEHWLYPEVVLAAARLIASFGEFWTSHAIAQAVQSPDWADTRTGHVAGRVTRPATFMLLPIEEM